MKQDIRKFTVGGIILLVGIALSGLLIDFVGQALIARLPTYSDRQLAKINFVLNKVNDDVIVMGSSRAAHHYNPAFLKKELDSFYNDTLSVYNAGVDGHFLNYNCCWIESLLNRHTPKIIMLDTEDTQLRDETTLMHDLAPYYNHNSSVTRYLNQTGWKERVKLLSNHYKYNEKLIRYMTGIFPSSPHSDGYSPLFNQLDSVQASKFIGTETKNGSTSKNEVNPIIIENLKHVMALCKEKQVTLIVVSSPRFGYEKQNTYTASLCKEHHIPYIDMASSDFFNAHFELFQDASHLNDIGANLFMEKLWQNLRPILDKAR